MRAVSKTGGLADVVGALPQYLQQLGCDVKVFLPKYNTMDESKFDLHYEFEIGEMPIRVGGVPWPVHISSAHIPGSSVPIYFVDCPHFFHRGRIYTNDVDEDGRFILFCKAVIETLQRLKWPPDVVHCNDWQTGLLPLLLRDNYGWDKMFDGTATLYIYSQHRLSGIVRKIGDGCSGTTTIEENHEGRFHPDL